MKACKECHKAGVRVNRKKRIRYYRAYETARNPLAHRMAARRAYQSTPKGKVAHARALKRSNTKLSQRYRARNALNNAVRDGKIVKPKACQKCRAPTPSRKLHGHHTDYRKPLVVRWICSACHHACHNV